jgi:hypothetical protein
MPQIFKNTQTIRWCIFFDKGFEFEEKPIHNCGALSYRFDQPAQKKNEISTRSQQGETRRPVSSLKHIGLSLFLRPFNAMDVSIFG